VCIPNELIHLKHLKLKNLTVTPQSLPFLSSLIQACMELVSLNIKSKSFQFVTYIAIYTCIISLYKYKLLFCSIDLVIKKNDIKVISNLTKLETLNLSWTTVNTLQNIYGLKKLTLQGCKNITSYDLTKVIESSPKLELLDVRRCKNINKAYIRKLVMCNNRLNNIPLKVLL